MDDHDGPALWDRIAREHGGAPPAPGMQEAIGALRSSLRPDDVVLDVGCGSGPVVRAIADRVHRVIGMDTSPGMIERAQASEPANATFCIGTLEDFSEHVTCAVLFNVLHHLDPAATFARLRDLLPRQGLVFAFEARHGHHHDGEDAHVGKAHVPFTPESFRELMDGSGFEVEAFEAAASGAWVVARR